jgi:hypothetical protein
VPLQLFALFVAAAAAHKQGLIHGKGKMYGGKGEYELSSSSSSSSSSTNDRSSSGGSGSSLA